MNTKTKMGVMLSDQTTYAKLKKDPIRKYKAELIRMINSLEKEGKITKEQYWYLYKNYQGCMDHQTSTRRVCHLDQLSTTIHRQYDTRYPESWLTYYNHLLKNTEHNAANSQELVKEMTQVRVEEYLVPYDVVSLFTKTPIKEAYEVIRKRLEKDKTLKKRTNLNVDYFMEPLTFVL